LESDIELIKDFGDGFKIIKLVGENAYKREGFLMRHCVGSYYGRRVEIYSLRDKENMPHCTMERDQQIKGRGNGSINPKYIKYIVAFLEEMGMSVGDSEMKNLGYVNIEIIKAKLHPEKNRFYNDKYLFQEATFYGDDGEEYREFDLWQYKPLVTKIGFEVKFNFEISAFIQSACAKILTRVSEKTAVANEHSSAAVANQSYSAAVANEHSSTAVAKGINSIALCRGVKSKAKGKLGAWLVLAEYDEEDENIINIVSGKIDNEILKEDVLYTVENGKFIAVKEG